MPSGQPEKSRWDAVRSHSTDGGLLFRPSRPPAPRSMYEAKPYAISCSRMLVHFWRRMSPLGQTRKSPSVTAVSVHPPGGDITLRARHVRFVPEAAVRAGIIHSGAASLHW